MADKFYTYSIATHFGGAFDSDNLIAEISASDITRAIRSVGSDGTDVTITFIGPDVLSASDQDLLQGASFPSPVGGLLAAHNSVAAANGPDQVEVSNLIFEPDGRQAMYSSPRPQGAYSTYFTGAGDDLAVGDGDKLLINMLSTDANKYVEVAFSETVLIKDGFIMCRAAPFGSAVSASIHHPDGTKLGGFVNRAPMIGDTFIHFNTDDYGTMPAGLKMRIYVENSNGTNGEDIAANFVVAARVEMFRETTV